MIPKASNTVLSILQSNRKTPLQFVIVIPVNPFDGHYLIIVNNNSLTSSINNTNLKEKSISKRNNWAIYMLSTTGLSKAKN